MPRKLYVVGTGPLLDPGAKVFSGQCLRTWHFAAPLLAAGHEVHLATVPIPGATIDDGRVASEWAYRDHAYTRFHTNDPARVRPVLAKDIETIRPDALIGINTYPAYLLSSIDCHEPLWADLNGWTMAEGQIRSAAMGNDRDFGHFWRQEVSVLLRADRISAVSGRQADATWGELAMVGRLNHLNAAEPMTAVIPNAVYPDFERLQRDTSRRPSILSGRVPEDAVICLWSGGFNSWTDVDALAWALGEAMKRVPNLCFVATGGPIVGHDEMTYRAFLDAAAVCIPPDRIHLLGWVDYETMLALHACSHFGLSLDGPNIETRFGARNRLTNMLGAGLPIVTSRGPEIAEWIVANGAGEVVPLGDRHALAEALARGALDRGPWEDRAIRARAAACRDFAPAHTIAPLLDWLKVPAPSADRIAYTDADEHFSSTARLRSYLERRLEEPIPFEAPRPPVSGGAVEVPDAAHPPRATSGSSMWKLIQSLRGRK